MSLTLPAIGNKFPIVITSKPYASQTLDIGTIAYQQTGVFGTPIGLLLSLTITPRLFKVIQTSKGLIPVS